MKLGMASAMVALSLITVIAVAGCTGNTPTSATKVYVTGDGNVTTVGTTGAGVGTAPCAGNATATVARNPQGSATQTGGAVSPDCASTTTLPPTPELAQEAS